MSPQDAAEHARRLAAVRTALRHEGFDAVVSADSGDWLPPTGDARYLSGFSIANMVNVFPGTAIVVPAAGEPTLVVPAGPQGGFAAWARATSWAPRVAAATGPLLDEVVTALREAGLERGRIGVCGSFPGFDELGSRLPDATVEPAVTVDGAGARRTLLERVRRVKSPWEVARMRSAQHAADVGMTTFMQEVTPGRRHVEAQALAEAAAVTAGAEAALTIMNSGSDPWMWWHHQGDRRFPDDHVVSLEVNARVDGYCAQLARTGVLGRTSAAQARLLEAAQESAAAMAASLRPGATGDDVWRAGTAPVEAAGLRAWGRLGHGMGLAMDEGLAVVPGDDTPLEPGMCLAVHASVWDGETQESALLGEQYLITEAGAQLLSEAVPPRTLAPSAPGTTTAPLTPGRTS